MTGTWVFGYGSLVSPTSFGETLGRDLTVGVDVFAAELSGFGRRWNYGVMHTRGVSDEGGQQREWTIIALGLVESSSETVNGVVCEVSEAELAALDRRERHYDRVDVSDRITVPTTVPSRAEIITYVPRPEARLHYETSRDVGTAAIDQRYWDLVDGAFAALGPDQRDRYHATTPSPDVPVVGLQRQGPSGSSR